MSKYTPGPWFIESDTNTLRHGECDGKLNLKSLEVEVFGTEEGMVNARLIAAAPIMLELIMELVEQPGQLNEDVIRMRRIIREIL